MISVAARCHCCLRAGSGGTLIYEGDIGRIHFPSIGKIQQVPYTGIVRRHCDGAWLIGNASAYMHHDSYTIIGNIHENAELLEPTQ